MQNVARWPPSNAERSKLGPTKAGEAVRVQVWDAAGDDLMHDPKICIPVTQGAGAALLIYDVTSEKTFGTTTSLPAPASDAAKASALSPSLT